MKNRLIKSLVKLLLVVVVIIAGFLLLVSPHTYVNNEHRFSLTYPVGWVWRENLVGDIKNFKFNSGNDTIYASYQYGTLTQIEDNYAHCAGDCPLVPPVIEHVQIAGADALKISQLKTGRDEPVLDYYIPVPTADAPIAILWLHMPSNPDQFHVLDEIAKSLRRI